MLNAKAKTRSPTNFLKSMASGPCPRLYMMHAIVPKRYLTIRVVSFKVEAIFGVIKNLQNVGLTDYVLLSVHLLDHAPAEKRGDALHRPTQNIHAAVQKLIIQIHRNTEMEPIKHAVAVAPFKTRTPF